MSPLRAFFVSFGGGLVALVAAQSLFVTLTTPAPEPVLQGPLHVPTA